MMLSSVVVVALLGGSGGTSALGPEGEKAKTKPNDEWLLGKFNFDLDGLVILE